MSARLAMMAEDYDRRAAVLRGEATAFRAQGRKVYARAANRQALKYEREAADCRATIARNAEASSLG